MPALLAPGRQARCHDQRLSHWVLTPRGRNHNRRFAFEPRLGIYRVVQETLARSADSQPSARRQSRAGRWV